jgi:hypothetical protein
MQKTLSQYDFTEAFRLAGRKDQFSYSGLKALFDYFEEMEDGCGEEMELDVIAICCEYSEYATARECCEDRGGMPDIDGMDDEEAEEACLSMLRDETQVIEHESGIIIAQY